MEHQSDPPRQRLALIELLGRDGQVLRSLDVWQWPVSIGRALDNELVVDDAYLAPRHARLAPDADGTLLLQALPSVNGLRMNGRPVDAPQPLPAAGALLLLGGTRLRLRLPGESLAAEVPLPRHAAPRPTPLAAALGLLVLALGGHWLDLDPGADYAAWLPLLLGLPLGVVGWCGAWALMSKLFQHRFDFMGHLRLALPWLLALGLAEALWPLATAALNLPALWMLGPTLTAVLGALLVHAHLAHLLPLHWRAVAVSVVALSAAGLALSVATAWRSHDRLVAQPYMSTLPPPALRLAGTVPTAELVQEIAPLADALARRVQQAQDDDEELDE